MQRSWSLAEPCNSCVAFQFGDAQRRLEASGTDTTFLLSLAYVLARTTSEQVRASSLSKRVLPSILH